MDRIDAETERRFAPHDELGSPRGAAAFRPKIDVVGFAPQKKFGDKGVRDWKTAKLTPNRLIRLWL